MGVNVLCEGKRCYTSTSTSSKERAIQKISQIINEGNLVSVSSEKQEPSLKNHYNKYGDINFDIKGYESTVQ